MNNRPDTSGWLKHTTMTEPLRGSITLFYSDIQPTSGLELCFGFHPPVALHLPGAIGYADFQFTFSNSVAINSLSIDSYIRNL